VGTVATDAATGPARLLRRSFWGLLVPRQGEQNADAYSEQQRGQETQLKNGVFLV
jgi:hypothetical protein